MQEFINCPGSKGIREPQPEFLKCPCCGKEVEIWTDEVKAACPKCKTIVMRNQGQSCLEWCKYAKECVGEKAYNQYIKNKEISRKGNV